MKHHLVSILLASLLLASGPANAHTALKSATPASGSVLTQSPPEISLTFIEPTRLVSVTVSANGQERRLRFSPGGPSQVFRVMQPGLPAGRNEIRWRGLSRDGHIVEGVVILVIRGPRPT
jgi:methionine-rich copper-binding protein CopC